MRFCDVCESHLQDVIVNDELIYICSQCNKEYKSGPSDTLRFEKKFSRVESTAKYETMIRSAAFDITNPRIEKQCPSCKKKIMSYVIVGSSMTYVYVCTCGYISQ